MKILAIIPARGGSKGIPNKNIQNVGGQPLIARTIESALKSDLLTRLIVSTDDKKIAQISKSSGSEVMMRSAEISDDNASSEEALLDVLGKLKGIGKDLNQFSLETVQMFYNDARTAGYKI